MQPTRNTTEPSAAPALAGDPSDERTTPRLALAAAERYGEASALEDGDVRLSFRAFWREGLRAARAFLAAGLRPGDRVGVWAPNLWEWPVAVLGIHAAGGVLVPLNTRMKGAEAGYVLRKSGARILVTLRGFLGTDYPALLRGEALPDLERTVVVRGEPGAETAWAAFLAEGARVPEGEARARALAVSPDDLSDVLFTSGTTGKPKGVMTCHGQNLRAFAAWSEVVGLRAGDRYLCVNPFFHAFGYKSGWLASLMRGATLLPEAVFDAQRVLERIGRDRISMLPGPPTLYQTILAHPERARFDLSSLRLAVTGAAAIPVELVRRMRDELGFETVVTGYGLTEACGIATMCRAGDDAETIAATSGRAIPGVEVICADRDGKPVARGEPGEVLVRGYNVMKGYFDDAAATREAIDADGWLHTGDIGVMDERGNLRITDRIKDMYITGGFNCYPAEIEGMLYGSGLCAHVAVIGVPDERQGEVGMAFVVPAPGRALAPGDVIAWCREHMANYKVPRRVEIVDALPTNASGKVTKFSLRERARGAEGRS
jgi:acyl-CoA synthetase (AMP-forming)/AMP-acid ligase II